MPDGVSSGVAAMALSQRRLDTVANNLANLSKTAFKREISFVQALTAANGRGRELSVSTRVDFSQGDLMRTENPWDLALDGEGFFAAEGENGEVYTREGSFFVGENGTLLTQTGQPVAWDEQRGAIDPQGESIQVDSEGTVSQDGRDIGRLRIVAFRDNARLVQGPAGYWRAPLTLRETAHTATVRQGHLEGSNVSPIEEMVAMISLQRSFESASNVLGLIGDTYRRLSRMQ